MGDTSLYRHSQLVSPSGSILASLPEISSLSNQDQVLGGGGEGSSAFKPWGSMSIQQEWQSCSQVVSWYLTQAGLEVSPAYLGYMT